MATLEPTRPPVRFRDDAGELRTGELSAWRRVDDGWYGQVIADNGESAVTIFVPASRLEPLERVDYRTVTVWDR